jgi:hypothetical protein
MGTESVRVVVGICGAERCKGHMLLLLMWGGRVFLTPPPEAPSTSSSLIRIRAHLG